MNNANLSAATQPYWNIKKVKEKKNVKFDTITTRGEAWREALRLHTWSAVVELRATKMNEMYGNYFMTSMKKKIFLYLQRNEERILKKKKKK